MDIKEGQLSGSFDDYAVRHNGSDDMDDEEDERLLDGDEDDQDEKEKQNKFGVKIKVNSQQGPDDSYELSEDQVNALKNSLMSKQGRGDSHSQNVKLGRNKQESSSKQSMLLKEEERDDSDEDDDEMERDYSKNVTDHKSHDASSKDEFSSHTNKLKAKLTLQSELGALKSSLQDFEEKVKKDEEEKKLGADEMKGRDDDEEDDEDYSDVKRSKIADNIDMLDERDDMWDDSDEDDDRDLSKDDCQQLDAKIDKKEEPKNDSDQVETSKKGDGQ